MLLTPEVLHLEALLLGVPEGDGEAHPHVLQVHVEVTGAAGRDEGEQVGVPPVQG